MSQYPYQILHLTDMKDELWKPFPVLGDYYAISNKGRVKSLERDNVGGVINRRREARIMRQRIISKKNPLSGKIKQALYVSTCVEGKTKYHTVSRLVYEAFVGPIPKRPNAIISHKDGDSLNNTPENLFLTDFNELHIRLINDGDRKPFIDYYDMSKLTKEEKYALHESGMKPVSQFDLHGNFIKTYKSISHAARESGVDLTSIGRTANGKAYTAGGFQWRYGHDQSPMKQAKTIRTYQNVKRTAKYDLQGKLLTVYPSITIAAQDNDIEATRLFGMLKYRNRIPKNGEKFVFRSYFPDEEIPEEIKIKTIS